MEKTTDGKTIDRQREKSATIVVRLATSHVFVESPKINRPNNRFSNANSRFAETVCFVCNRKGHVARMCRSARANPSS